jgi:hypothetical protein
MQLWPFQPLPRLSPDERHQWVAQCYVRAGWDRVLQDPHRSAVLIAMPGSGLTTSLTLLELLRDQHRLLTFKYSPDQWPGQRGALITGDDQDHFPQFMAHIAEICTDTLKRDPEKLARISLSGHEFLIWMVRYYLGQRRSNLWLRQLEQHHQDTEMQKLIDKARTGEFDTLYTSANVSDIHGQIEECLDLVQSLGWNGIYAIVDINAHDWLTRAQNERASLIDGVKRLLETLTPLQRAGFGFKMGIPPMLLSKEECQLLSRDRVDVISYTWTPDALWEVADRQFTAATGQQHTLRNSFTAGQWQLPEADMRSIWGQPCPAGMSAITKHIVQRQPAGPLSDQDLQALRKNLYASHATLYYDAHSSRATVWRGMTRLTLEEAQIRVFDLLWRSHGKYIQNEELLDVAGSKVNLDKIISRIRQVIEPLGEFREYIYLQRTAAIGVWLEHCTFP